MTNQPLKPDHLRLAIHNPKLIRESAKKKRVVARRGKKDKAKKADPDIAALFNESRRTSQTNIRSLLMDAAQLKRYGLPVWETEADLAKALKISINQLRFYSIHRNAEKFSHYVAYTIPKRFGGLRLIMAPKKGLKEIQRKLVKLLINKLPCSEQAHGYRTGRNVRTGAEVHVGKQILVQMDLQDFFPTITYQRVRGLFLAMGYGYAVAAALGALTTEARRQPVEVEGTTFYVPVGDRHTVQGAPTSPGISNTILLKLDRRLNGLAQKHGFAFTRYADDITFSGDQPELAYKIRMQAKWIIQQEGFRVHPEKNHIARSGRRQQVTGVTVNQTLGLSRQERRKLRAAIHHFQQAQADGRSDPKQLQILTGRIAYLKMLNPKQAAPFVKAMASLNRE